MDVLSISVRTGVMTALEHLSSLVERSINHKIYHYTVQVIFLTVILRVKQVEKGRMKLEICTYKHSLRREIKISWFIWNDSHLSRSILKSHTVWTSLSSETIFLLSYLDTLGNNPANCAEDKLFHKRCFCGWKKRFQPRGLGMLHLKFFQERCSLEIDQQRGQCLQRPVVLAHAQKHNLECSDRRYSH